MEIESHDILGANSFMMATSPRTIPKIPPLTSFGHMPLTIRRKDYQVLYFQLITVHRIYFAKYFSARTIICAQNFAPQYNCGWKQSFDYSARTTVQAIVY
jgi:hypothetical protein